MPPLAIFPTESGVPGDGSLLAVHGGGSTEVVGGLIHYAQVIEAYPLTGVTLGTTMARRGEPLLADGVTIWVEGSLLLNERGEPTTSDFTDILSRWTTLRNKLLLANYELFVYYATSPATYRKYKSVNTVFLHCAWSNPVTLTFLLGAATSDTTLYTTAPGA